MLYKPLYSKTGLSPEGQTIDNVVYGLAVVSLRVFHGWSLSAEFRCGREPYAGATTGGRQSFSVMLACQPALSAGESV